MKIIGYDIEGKMSINEVVKIDVVWWQKHTNCEDLDIPTFVAKENPDYACRVRATCLGDLDDVLYIDRNGDEDYIDYPENIDEANKIIIELLSLMNGEVIDLRETKFVIL